jgi:hypothetical protein
MRLLLIALCLFSFQVLYAQFNSKSCPLPAVAFAAFQKSVFNVPLGAGIINHRVSGANDFGFNLQAGANYFPLKYLETGVRFKLSWVSYAATPATNLQELNIYTRWYLFSSSCWRSLVFIGGSVVRDGSPYTAKGEKINTNLWRPAFNSGIAFALSRHLQAEVYGDVFFNSPYRTNVGLLWNVFSRMKKQS